MSVKKNEKGGYEASPTFHKTPSHAQGEDELYTKLFRFARTDAAAHNLMSVVQAEISKQREQAQQELASQIINVGHNLDCISCGLKDKIAKQTLADGSKRTAPKESGDA